jgi:putative FmdB family regulatory protein
MPTYEYQCDACDHNFDEFQSFSEEPLKKCPKCGKKKLRRLFGGGAAILFKGSGFYETDYRSESYKQGAKAEQEAAKPAEGTGSSNGASVKTDQASPGKERTTPKGSGKSSRSAT